MAALIVDTDPGADDALALMLLAAQPDTEIVAVGSVHGNVPAALAADNALRVLDVLGLPHVPVAMGADVPYSGEESTFTALHVHGSDGLGGYAGESPSRKPTTESAAEQIVRLARDRSNLALLALGPLTNLALALDLEPDLPLLLREVVWCGGAVHAAGNVTAHAEANARNDPEAAEKVLAAGFTMTMVPLDVTGQAWADGAWLDQIGGGAVGRSAAQWIGHYVRFYSKASRGCLLYDPLAAAIAVNPELARYERHRVRVELVGYPRGATLLCFRAGENERRPVRVAMSAHVDVMLDQLRRALR
ncbi:nucleoside hydrolase [Actinocrispum wychmicini]|uniref:Purine nucleosidase n=1 Tax=Actinocrispum wychmicini TaxID=1213861 RepID=A0A4R2J779_9PSEU|nr:nucleoside hydrolase [Actinocrispum wychmicini]TCO54933.1 purine nucleosidase [Actinocrispum wychmicini]